MTPLADDSTVLRAAAPGGPAWRSYHVAAVDGLVLVGGGSESRFRTALRRIRDKATSNNLEPETAAYLARGDASSLLVRFPVVAARLEDLLKEDLGAGADGLTVRTLVQRARTFALRARDVWLALENRGPTLHADVRVRLGNTAP